MVVEVNGVSIGWIPDKRTQPGKNQREFYGPTLEGEIIDPTGGPGTSPMVRPLWDTHANGTAVEAKQDGQM